MNTKLTLRPGDYIVYIGGLKIENIGDKIIEMDTPESYMMYPFEIVNKSGEQP